MRGAGQALTSGGVGQPWPGGWGSPNTSGVWAVRLRAVSAPGAGCVDAGPGGFQSLLPSSGMFFS